MTFNSTETSQQNGRPIEAYEFVFGPGPAHVYRFTNGDTDRTGPTGTFKAIPIQRERYVSSGTTDKSSLKIRTPVTTDLSNLFRSYPPTQPVLVNVWQGHLGDGEWIVAWTGRILSVTKEGSENVMTCESTIISLKRPGLRRNYQYACPYVLYGPGCMANKGAATFPATVESVSGGLLVLGAGWNGPHEPKRFSGGMIQWEGESGLEVRTILRVDEATNRITIIGPLRDLEVGDAVQVILGCNRLMDGCHVHNNIVNFGGQPWIPLRNPVKYHPFW